MNKVVSSFTLCPQDDQETPSQFADYSDDESERTARKKNPSYKDGARLRPQLHRESNFVGPTSRPAPTVKGPVRMSSIGKIDATTPRILAGFGGTIHKFPLPTNRSIITQPPSPLTPTMLIQPRRHTTTASHLLLSLAGNPIWGSLLRHHLLLLRMQCTSITPTRQTIWHGLRHIS